MLAEIRRQLLKTRVTPEERERIYKALPHLNSAGIDPWGLDPKAVEEALGIFRRIYRDYFRVETTGIEQVPEGRVLLIANHSGQIPLDGILIGMSMFLESEPPRVTRAMVERWIPSVPFISSLFSRFGQMVGDHHNCRDLLEHDQCVLVFPEGVRGSGKTIFNKYQLQRFGTGFIRLALETRAPIVPIAVIGCEETMPSIHDLKPLAKLLSIPYLPVTIPFPLPCKVTLRYGKPIYFDGDPDCSEAEIEAMVDQVRKTLAHEIDEGLKIRGDRYFSGSAK